MNDQRQDDCGINPTALVDDQETVALASLTDGARFGRYRIVHRIGSGGMGTVFAAFDPTLDRTVALKVLHERVTAPDAEQRLLREAQAMARLSHPNVVTVHDAGMEDGRPYVAMELVEGCDLEGWLKQRERTPLEVLDAFLAAGRGLSAAHAAGLIHRDFKPGNVLVGADGRVRVTDFGLARAATPGSTAAAGIRAALRPSPDRTTGSSSPLETPLTRHGAVVGTPAYMAPEQALEGRADHRSDQWAFCVSLYAALFGRHPLGEFSNLSQLVAAFEHYEIAPPRALPGIPKRAVAAIMKGLSRTPEDRFADMDALLEELRIGPALRRRRRAIITAAAVVVVAAAMVTAYVVHRAQLCSGGDLLFSRVWNDTLRQQLERQFAAQNPGAGTISAAAVAKRIESYGERWAASRREACVATRIRGERSESLLDRQMSCLDRRLREADHLIAILIGADNDLAAAALDAVVGLSAPEACTESTTIVEREPLPAGDRARQEYLEFSDTLAAAKAEQLAGDYETALARTDELLPAARALGYHPLLAEVLLLKGFVETALGRPDDAQASLTESFSVAELGRDDAVGASAALNLMYVTGAVQGRFDEAERWSELALAKIDRQGGNDDVLADYLHARAQVLIKAGRNREAVASLKQALRLINTDYGENSIDAAIALTTMGDALSSIGDYRAAVESYQRSLALKEAIVGPRHPTVGFTLSSLAQAYSGLGEHERSIELCRRALAVQEQAFGPDHPNLGVPLNNLAYGLEWVGRYDEAKEIHRRSIDIVSKAWGENTTQVAISYLNLSSVEYRSGDIEAAIDAVRRAKDIFEATVGADHPLFAYAANNLGVFLMKTGDAVRGAALLEQALAIRDNPDVDPALLAETRFNLGRAWWEAGKRAVGRQTVEFAEREVATLATPDEEFLAEIREWLANH